MNISAVLTDVFFFHIHVHILPENRFLACFLPAKKLLVMKSRLHPWTCCGLDSGGLYLCFLDFQPSSKYSSRQMKALACIFF